jgi:hypothetical protein
MEAGRGRGGLHSGRLIDRIMQHGMNHQARENNRSSASPEESTSLPPAPKEFWILEDAERRLRTHFPNLLKGLEGLRSHCDISYIELAAEHPITAEALIETLDSGGDLSAGRPKLTESGLDSEFRQRVIDKVKAFAERPAPERELMKQVYHDIDPDRIALAHKHRLIPDDDVVWALQQAPVYFSVVLPKLNDARMLTESERKQLEFLQCFNCNAEGISTPGRC